MNLPMNLIVKFADPALRDELLERLRARRPEILEKYTAARTMPHAIFDNLDDEQASDVRACTEGLGEVFEDIQFEPFGGPQ